MKSLIVAFLLLVVAWAAQAGSETVSYVTVGGKTYFCQDLKSGLFRASLTLDDGTTLKIPYEKIDAYMCNGHLYERMPLMCPYAKPGCTALMEYVTSRNGLRLYKYCRYGSCCDPANDVYKPVQAQYLYTVFKDGKFFLKVDQENAASILPFFGIEVIQ